MVMLHNRSTGERPIGERPVFVPLRVEGMVAAADNNKDRPDTPRSVAVGTGAPVRPGTLEIESGGVRVRFSGPVDATTLRLVMTHIGRRA